MVKINAFLVYYFKRSPMPCYFLDTLRRSNNDNAMLWKVDNGVTQHITQGASGQGGDTRREEVLSKVLVDISIHTTSHASDTAQNKLCSFWMGPVLLWSVIN